MPALVVLPIVAPQTPIMVLGVPRRHPHLNMASLLLMVSPLNMDRLRSTASNSPNCPPAILRARV